jgi:hypothetical protein
VKEQVTNPDIGLGAVPELREVVTHAVFEVEPFLCHEQHHRGGEPHHFGQAGKVIDGGISDWALVGNAVPAKRVGEDHLPAVTHQHDAARKCPVCDLAVEILLQRWETGDERRRVRGSLTGSASHHQRHADRP